MPVMFERQLDDGRTIQVYDLTLGRARLAITQASAPMTYENEW